MKSYDSSKLRFDEAFDEYLAKLKRTRSPKWAEIVEGIGRNHLSHWKGWRLDRLAKSPKIVREWHAKLALIVGPRDSKGHLQICRIRRYELAA
jgi:hypothetical protein